MRTWRRIAGAAAAVGVLVSLQGCVFVVPNSIRAFSQFRKLHDQALQDLLGPGVPEVEIVLNAAGGDAVRVYLPDAGSERFRIAEAAAASLGASGTPAVEDPLEPDAATVQLDRRLASRSGAVWTLSFDTASLRAAVGAEGFDAGFDLFVCHPAVETRIVASRPPDYGEGDATCFRGVGWSDTGEPLQATVTMRPRTAHYLAFVAGSVLGIVLAAALAWFVADQLRRGPFRRRTTGAIALGVVVGIIVGTSAGGTVAAVGAGLGPADNLALARDLGVVSVASVALPALAAAIPGIIFAALLVRRRPWPEEPEPERWGPWPVSPPPGGAGGPPPPPIPWGVR